MVASIIVVTKRDIDSWWLSATILAVSGIALLMIAATSALWIENGDLVARDFGRTRRLELARISRSEPALFGLFFKTDDGRRMRSSASSASWDEWWEPRAERICNEIKRRADEARKA